MVGFLILSLGKKHVHFDIIYMYDMKKKLQNIKWFISYKYIDLVAMLTNVATSSVHDVRQEVTHPMCYSRIKLPVKSRDV